MDSPQFDCDKYIKTLIRREGIEGLRANDNRVRQGITASCDSYLFNRDQDVGFDDERAGSQKLHKVYWCRGHHYEGREQD